MVAKRSSIHINGQQYLTHLADLAEKFGGVAIHLTGRARRVSVLAVPADGAGPFLGGFGNLYACAPPKIEYAIDRYAMEVERHLDVLDKRLARHERIAGAEYTIADIAIWPWYGGWQKGVLYDAAEFLDVHSYTHALRWARVIAARPAAKRGRLDNHAWGAPGSQLKERHDASNPDRLVASDRGGAR